MPFQVLVVSDIPTKPIPSDVGRQKAAVYVTATEQLKISNREADEMVHGEFRVGSHFGL